MNSRAVKPRNNNSQPAAYRQWKVKTKALASIQTDDADKKQKVAELQSSLNEFITMKLTDMKVNGYPPPLDRVGDKKFEELGAVKAAPKKKRAPKKVVVKQ